MDNNNNLPENVGEKLTFRTSSKYYEDDEVKNMEVHVEKVIFNGETHLFVTHYYHYHYYYNELCVKEIKEKVLITPNPDYKSNSLISFRTEYSHRFFFNNTTYYLHIEPV